MSPSTSHFDFSLSDRIGDWELRFEYFSSDAFLFSQVAQHLDEATQLAWMKTHRRERLAACQGDREMIAFTRQELDGFEELEPKLRRQILFAEIDTIMTCYGFDGGHGKSYSALSKLLSRAISQREDGIAIANRANEATQALESLVKSMDMISTELAGLHGVVGRTARHFEAAFEVRRGGLEAMLAWTIPALSGILGPWLSRNGVDLCPAKYGEGLFSDGVAAVESPIRQMAEELRKHPQAIFDLAPRRFEMLLQEIFQAFGFDVQLTSQTRDGGADLICMLRPGGIPIKVAVEAKRYAANRAISVELVRQFVGANQQLQANKLIYVTTSRYTPDAIRFAKNPYNVHLLELKDLSDVIQWLELI